MLIGATLGAAASAERSPAASAAASPNLGAPPTPCPSTALTCCPGAAAACNANPKLVFASPFLVQTAIGTESISPDVIHVGQKFTLTWHSTDPYAAQWTFPDNIGQKLTSCKTGVDVTCTYRALARGVTYPAFANYDGWSEFEWGAIDRNGAGVGYGAYAIIGPGIPVSGRLQNKQGQGIPRGGVPAGPTGITPDPGVVIDFSVKRHGVLTPIYAAGPNLHGSVAHPYDVGYYGLIIKKPGTYTVTGGDFFQHIRCKSRVLHVTHEVRNFNLVCT
jgi:hypothetical protein